MTDPRIYCVTSKHQLNRFKHEKMLWLLVKLEKKNTKIVACLSSEYILIIFEYFKISEVFVFKSVTMYPINYYETADSQLHMVIEI